MAEEMKNLCAMIPVDLHAKVRAQQEASGLRIENGWTYFIHGWTQVIAEVFHIAISGDRLAMCDQLAR